MEPQTTKETAPAEEAAGGTRLLLSQRLGRPPYVLDPKDLPGQYNPCPDKLGAHIRQIDEQTLVKFGSNVRLAEAEAMHMVSEQTTVVCPQVIGAYILNEVGYIIMSFEQGEDLPQYWDKAASMEREHVIAQLKDYVKQMRAIRGDFIGGVDYSSCKDGIFDWDYRGLDREYGPYADEASFNDGIAMALANRVPPARCDPDPESVGFNNGWMEQRLARSFKGHDIVFTHADLHSGNILVRADGTVVLLDWGLAGYWPEYWEFYRATFMGTFRPDFIREIERFIPPFYMEAFVMRQIFDKLVGG